MDFPISLNVAALVLRPGTNNPTRTWVDSTLRVASQRFNQFD